MDIQIGILEESVLILMGIVNSIDRTKTIMYTTYPDWDDTDTDEFRDSTVLQLNAVITKLETL